MKNLKKISGNELSELLQMMNELSDVANRKYIHVSDHLHKFTLEIEKVRATVLAELLRREDQF